MQAPLSELNVPQLQTFCEVMKAGGYAAAARITGQSVPTIWQHIRALEKVYGVQLFRKVGRQVEATAVAEELYESVSTLLAGLESSFDIAHQAASNDRGCITLVAGMRMLVEDLATPLRQFQRQHPGRLVILHGNNNQAEQMVLSGQADLGLALQPGYRQESKLVAYQPAYQVEFLAIAHKQHPFARANYNGLADLVQHDLIVTVAGTHGRDALERAMHEHNLAANFAVETDNSGFTIACVQAKMGVGVLAGRRSGSLCKPLAVKSLHAELGSRKIVFMVRRGRQLTRPLLALMQAIREIEP